MTVQISNSNNGISTINEWSSTDEDWPLLNAVEDDDYFNELYDGFGTRCQACFGTGMDRYEEVDCLNCWGEGVVYASL